MTYRIDFDSSINIVHVIYGNNVTLQERIEAVENVCSHYIDFKPLKILVDVRDLVMSLSFHEQQSFGEYLATHRGLINARVAVVHKSSHNPNVVIDTVAFSNGYKLAEFKNIKDAEAWLSRC